MGNVVATFWVDEEQRVISEVPERKIAGPLDQVVVLIAGWFQEHPKGSVHVFKGKDNEDQD